MVKAIGGGGGVRCQKNKRGLFNRTFYADFSGFGKSQKFQVLSEISRETRRENDHFRTPKWAKIETKIAINPGFLTQSPPNLV